MTHCSTAKVVFFYPDRFRAMREMAENHHLNKVCEETCAFFNCSKEAFEARESSISIETRAFASAILIYQHFYDRGRVEYFLDLTSSQSKKLGYIFHDFFSEYSAIPEMDTADVLEMMQTHGRFRINAKSFGRPVADTYAPASIVSFVSSFTGVPSREIMSHRHAKDALTARKVAIYACRYLTGMALVALASFLGRATKSIAHSMETVENELIAAGGAPQLGLEMAALLNFLADRMPDLNALRCRAGLFSCPTLREIA